MQQYKKDVGTPMEVFKGIARKTSDGRIQADFDVTATGRVALRNAPPKKPLPESFARFAEAKKQVLGELKPGEPFERHVVRKGTEQHSQILERMKKMAEEITTK